MQRPKNYVGSSWSGPRGEKQKHVAPPAKKRRENGAETGPRGGPGEAFLEVFVGTPRRGGISRRKCVENAYFFDFPKAGKNIFFP